MDPSSNPPFSVGARRQRLAAAAVAFWAATAMAQPTLPKDSPFLPPAAAGTAAAPGENLEFAGVSTIGQRIDLVIHDKAAKRSRWIALGETVAGITALKYDARLEQAVVRANGIEKVLRLRKGTGPANSPAAVIPPFVPTALPAVNSASGQPATAWPAATATAPLPAPPPPPATSEIIAKQEVEARMLGSDLLEIGMAQRKAYEDAQRQNVTDPSGADFAPAGQPAAPAP